VLELLVIWVFISMSTLKHVSSWTFVEIAYVVSLFRIRHDLVLILFLLLFIVFLGPLFKLFLTLFPSLSIQITDFGMLLVNFSPLFT